MRENSDSIDPAEQTLAYGLLRIAFGVAFVGHGFFRIFSGVGHFATTTADHLARSPLPSPFVYGFGLAIPWIELTLGVALVLGIITRTTLILGTVFMMALTIGASSNQDWSAVDKQLLYSLVFFVLLFAVRYNRFSVDRMLERGRSWPPQSSPVRSTAAR